MLGRRVTEEEEEEEERGRGDGGGERLRLPRSVVVGDAVLEAEAAAARRAAERVTRALLEDDEDGDLMLFIWRKWLWRVEKGPIYIKASSHSFNSCSLLLRS